MGRQGAGRAAVMRFATLAVAGALITIHVEPENKAKHAGIVVI